MIYTVAPANLRDSSLKRALFIFDIFRFVFKILSDLPDPIKQSGSVFSKWDLNTF